MLTRTTVNDYIRSHLNDDFIVYGTRDRGYAFEITPRPKYPVSFDDILIGPGPYMALKESGLLYAFGSASDSMDVVSSPTLQLFQQKVSELGNPPIDTIGE